MTRKSLRTSAVLACAIFTIPGMAGGCSGFQEAVTDAVKEAAKEEIDATIDELLDQLLAELDTLDLPPLSVGN